LLTSCSPRASAAAPALEASALTVAVAPVTRQDLSRTLELAAEFRPYQEVDLHAKVAGYVKRIYVDVGDHVKAGQRIAELEAPEMAQELAQAEATRRRAESEVERARSELKRAEAAQSIQKVSFDRLAAVVKVRPNLVAQQELDAANERAQEADAQVAAAQSGVAAAEEQLAAAAAGKDRYGTALEYLRIIAPFDGVVTKRLADTGAMIQAGTASKVQAMPLVQLSQVSRLRLVLPVPESAVPIVREGMPVEVRVESLKRVLQGRVARFTGQLDASTRTMATEVDVDNRAFEIKPGMFGYATLALESRPNALAVPVQALSGRSAPVTVLVVGKDKKLEERRVTLGLETPDLVEVLSGLADDDLVIVGSRGTLRPGLLVQPRVTGGTATGEAR